jgi:hypothetical protein
MGSADSYSDFDLYVYTQTLLPVEQKIAVFRQRATEAQLNNTFWELEDEWIDRDGRRFSAMYRACSDALGKIDERLERYSPIVEHIDAMLKRLDEWLNCASPDLEKKQQ